MFNLDINSKIYVVCPAYNKTGGTELAHQLVFELNKRGKNAYITYYGEDSKGMINPAFQIYVSDYKVISEIEDKKNNLLVLPEIKQGYVTKYASIQKAIWWMSVDNFVKRNGFWGCAKFYGIPRAVKRLLTGHISIIGNKINKDAVHFYQSEYALQFLRENGITKVHRLSDYINQTYIDDESIYERKDYVLYNPKKGIEFTKKLIECSKNELKWIPIENMTTDEVRILLRSSKVYVDFGNHPGKDRFPREAAISGCCVITGKRGSAKYYEDIPINDEFKFDDMDSNLSKIVNVIKNCIIDYETEIKKFKKYREIISLDRKVFENDIDEIFK